MAEILYVFGEERRAQLLFGCKVVKDSDNMDKVNLIAMRRTEDCLGCKLVSGGGLVGAGLYVAFQSKRANNLYVKVAMNTIALGAAGLGFARIFNLPPFNYTNKSNKENQSASL